MQKRLTEILAEKEKIKRAVACGTAVHAQLQHVTLDINGTSSNDHGNADLIEKIRKNLEIARFFTAGAGTTIRTEVPIAGMVNGRFISRRIDRMIIKDNIIEFLDYKTDADKTLRHDKYAAQIGEYAVLLRAAYPGREIHGHILWTHDWELEKVI